LPQKSPRCVSSSTEETYEQSKPGLHHKSCMVLMRSSARSPNKRSKVELVSTLCLASDDHPDDSGSYCPCVVEKLSEDRHTNCLVEIYLKASFRVVQLNSLGSKNQLHSALLRFRINRHLALVCLQFIQRKVIK